MNNIYDNFIDDETNNSIHNLFQNIEWKYGDKSITSLWKDSLPHWSKYFYKSEGTVVTIAKDVILEHNCLQKLYEKIILLLPSNAKLIRCYANAHTYGNDGNIHYDDIREDTTTFIFYPMKEWNIDWGGETILWDREKREITKSIIPKSNRLIQFASNTWHGARPLSRYCSKLRITLMFKFILE